MHQRIEAFRSKPDGVALAFAPARHDNLCGASACATQRKLFDVIKGKSLGKMSHPGASAVAATPAAMESPMLDPAAWVSGGSMLYFLKAYQPLDSNTVLFIDKDGRWYAVMSNIHERMLSSGLRQWRFVNIVVTQFWVLAST